MTMENDAGRPSTPDPPQASQGSPRPTWGISKPADEGQPQAADRASLEAARAYKEAGAPPLNPVPIEDIPYHRLWRSDPTHRWWKPLVEFCISGPLYMVLAVLITVLMFAAPAITGGPRLTVGPNGYPDSMLDHPSIFGLMFLSIAIMVPCVLLARFFMGPRPLGLIFSVTGRMRWGWLMRCFVAGLVIFLLAQLVGVLLGGGMPSPTLHGSVTVWLLVISIILVPIQCVGEELAFRGFLLQSIGRWLNHPAWAVLLPVPLFVLSHGYDLWGLISVGILAIIAGFLCIATGGLEASIGLHVSNNLTTILLGVFGMADPFGATDIGPSEAVMTVIIDGLYAVVVLWMARRQQVETRRPAVVAAQSWPGWALHNAGLEPVTDQHHTITWRKS